MISYILRDIEKELLSDLIVQIVRSVEYDQSYLVVYDLVGRRNSLF